jgi:hypothetical protein
LTNLHHSYEITNEYIPIISKLEKGCSPSRAKHKLARTTNVYCIKAPSWFATKLEINKKAYVTFKKKKDKPHLCHLV